MRMAKREARDVARIGRRILASSGMQSEKRFVQHGDISVFAHSLAVAVLCLWLSRRLPGRSDERALVRGALLHDYFLYDWHEDDPSHRWHGFHHAAAALRNAEREFSLSRIERDMISSHMFPLNLRPPRCRESAILCVADKIVATRETVRGLFRRRRQKA